MLRLHAARKPEHDRVLEVKRLQDPLQRLVGDLRPLPLTKTRMREIIKHLAADLRGTMPSRLSDDHVDGVAAT